MKIDVQNQNKIKIPNEVLFEQVRACLREGKQVIIPVKGGSMRPFLSEGDRVLLKAFAGRDLTRGMIVLAGTGDDMVLHRVVRYDRSGLWLAGDANLSMHEGLNRQDVVAVAVSVFRNRKEICLDSGWARFWGLLWYGLRPLRRIMMKIFKWSL